MGDWLKRKAIGLGLGILGLAAWLGYHSFIGSDNQHSKELEHIPTKVFAGGGGNLTLSIQMNKSGYLLAEFSRGDQEKEKVVAREDLKDGDHYYKIDLPPDLSYGYFELEINDATVGSQIAWSVELDGKEVTHDSQTLQEPLKQNEAFGLQLEFNDLAELRSYGENRSGGED